MNSTLQNPFLIPPQVESPESRSWGLGFAFGFQGPEQSTMTPADIQPEDADAFDQGVLAAQDSAIKGLSLPQPCVDLNAEGGLGPHLVFDVPDAAFWIAELFHAFKKAAFAGGIGGTVIFFVNMSIALETFTDGPTMVSGGALFLAGLSQCLLYPWAHPSGSISLTNLLTFGLQERPRKKRASKPQKSHHRHPAVQFNI